MTQQNNDAIHKFELAGMGKAPFKIVGFYKLPSASMAEHNPSVYQAQMENIPTGFGCGSCAFCSTPLVNNYLIQSADGKKSAVGCDCVGKTGDAGLTTKVKEMQRIARREARVAKREAEYQAKLEKQREMNGGKTNAEILEDKRAQREIVISEGKAAIKPELKEIAMALKGAYGDFAYNVYTILRDVELRQLSPNMKRITLEIAAKQISGSRKGSKAYTAQYDRLEPVLTKAIEEYNALLEKNPVVY